MDLPAATIQYVRGDHRGLDVNVPQEFLGQSSAYLKHPFKPRVEGTGARRALRGGGREEVGPG